MNILKILTSKRKTGNFGEDAAVKFLKKNGYKILERNYVANGYEIDIIARKNDITAFIEVKTRNVRNLGIKEARPACSVTPEKQRKIISAASYYRGCVRLEGRMRFDVIEVYIETAISETSVKDIKHLTNTFDKNTAYSHKFY